VGASRTTRRSRRKTVFISAILGRPLALALAFGVVSVPAVYAARSVRVDAHPARTLNVTDEAHLHLTTTAGELLEEEGQATGALPGKIRARFRVGATVSGSYTFYPRGGGSITGSGSAHLHSTGVYASFGGTLRIGHGTGRYAHAHGTGGLYGVVNRHTDALTVQTTGRLSY
jgi:hypothetical protein